MHPENKESPKKGQFVGLFVIWLLTILVLQFTIWVTVGVLDFDVSWRQAGLVSALWVFTSVWFTALRYQKKQ